MKSFLTVFLFTFFASQSIAFEGVVHYKQVDKEGDSIKPSSTQSIRAYFKKNMLRKIALTFDSSLHVESLKTKELFQSANGLKVATKINGGKPVVKTLAQKQKTPFFLQKGNLSEKIIGRTGVEHVFPKVKNRAADTVIFYSPNVVVDPQSFSLEAFDSMSWGVNPDTGQLALRFVISFRDGKKRIIEAVKIEERSVEESEVSF